jgi:Zn-finger nucleic acid-binding protein
MKRENCPFCAHRWIRKSNESPITCPNCKRKYYDRMELDDRLKKEQVKK